MNISYMVADLKYNTIDGVKICEVQHGALSALSGDINGSIVKNIANYFDQYDMLKWVSTTVYTPLRLELEKHGWISKPLHSIISDSQFVYCVDNHINALVYATIDIVNTKFNTLYPSIIFLDLPTLPYWKDKYKMNSLIILHKAEWVLLENYKNEYDKIVLKPLHECMGRGIIVINDENKLNINSEKYLVEKYYPSDYLIINNEKYDATLRIVFILNNQNYELMGAYWKIPENPIHIGTLYQQHISMNHGPYYEIDNNLLMLINEQVKESMLSMYENMLK